METHSDRDVDYRVIERIGAVRSGRQGLGLKRCFLLQNAHLNIADDHGRAAFAENRRVWNNTRQLEADIHEYIRFYNTRRIKITLGGIAVTERSNQSEAPHNR